MAKKLIILFLILSIFIIGCKGYTQSTDYKQSNQPPQNPAVGGGCGVIENENQKEIINYAIVTAGL